MQIRTEIIVKGEVQRVGYRDVVEKIARKLIKRGGSEEETAERLDFINSLLKNLVNTVSISTMNKNWGEK